MTISEIEKHLIELGFNTEVLNLYNQPHRFYHTQVHLADVILFLKSNQKLSNELFLVAVYHDAVYNPKSKTNELDSANLFEQDAIKANYNKEKIKLIKQIILDTASHKASCNESEEFIKADLNIFNQSLSKLIEYENQIFKEFQFVNYLVYKKERIKVLQKFNTNKNVDALIQYVEARKPLIGVFCGSFNPFHKGHYNVLQKAERICDKVIIAFGKNPEKNERNWPIPQTISFREQLEYNGLLTDFLDNLGYDVIVIRGLRNSTDFQYEQNQYRYIQELKPQVKIINIFCDKEFEHISSSGIRTLEKYNKHQNYLLD
ncbi:MAG: adenylyltransferase/cytidyltransferase family protein [Bacteroidetes bacterium]|nr:adenylyltransferase/cytidyltransferase family protein [Bacteroidota bacterium]